MHSALSASVIYKILAVFMLFCLSKASGGTCLSYGHSCWGGHGKRSGAGHLIGPTASQKRSNEWYLSKLFTPSLRNSKKIEALFKTLKPDPEEIDKLQQYGYQIYPISDMSENNPRDEAGDSEIKPTKWSPDGSESEEEVVVLAPEMQQVPLSKYRILEVMNQEETKKRIVK